MPPFTFLMYVEYTFLYKSKTASDALYFFLMYFDELDTHFLHDWNVDYSGSLCSLQYTEIHLR